ncbi:hypothetical protein ACHAWU_004721 [Discostella pseudostelligera]|uniref:Uncharacterized protein n=1 Tax=Discostella pseudostelligera TaxID=259834 RepID=A0ABD3M4G3_9STRA
MNTSRRILAQALMSLITLPFASGQHIVFVSSAAGVGGRGADDHHLDLDTQLMRMMSPPALPFTTGATSHLMGGYSTEPPCRSRRLEPFRQHVREECRLEAATQCTTMATPVTTTSMTTSRMMNTPAYTNDLWLNSLMESPSSPSTEEDPFDKMMISMLQSIGQMMDLDVDEQWMIGGTDSVSVSPPVMNRPSEPMAPLAELPDVVETNVGKGEDEAVPSPHSSEASSASGSSSSDDIEFAIDNVAENSLDVLVATLADRFIHSEDVDSNAKMDTNLPASKRVENLSQHLSKLGDDLLAETRIARSRRRLQEASTSDGDAIDQQLQVKERLARRLTEYRTDLVYHPDGTISVYTSSFHPYHHSIVSPLGMGSTHVDECMKSRYENGDLVGSCFDAVSRFFAAVNDRNLSPPSHSSSSSSRSSSGGAGAGDDEPWYYTYLKFACVWMMVALPFELYICCSRKGAYADDDANDNDEEGDSFDYEMLPEEENIAPDRDRRAQQEEERAKVPRVYLGVPVQVV